MRMSSYRDVTVGGLLTELAAALPDNPALVYETAPRFTFAELEREANTIARGLIAAGVEPAERVVVWSTNIPEWVVLQFALAKIGAILVTANTALRARDIDYLIRQSEAATVVTTDSERSRNRAAPSPRTNTIGPNTSRVVSVPAVSGPATSSAARRAASSLGTPCSM